ncbi:low molecular weight protein-tyrosine-phosphatase [Paraburkholderia sp. PREW-6R]|uniref:low molecular weight protein-tyrosine-phosphatase n=1 Tax=Paraburkholderia sp. PREW-6R TaxID=3141544 RepID=UPI0031F5A20E
MICRVLVVCAGNICRSPMAAALLEQTLETAAVASAGLTALIGYEADPMAVSLMSERGLDIRPHRARQLVGWMVASADLVLTMDQRQKQHVERGYPLSRGRVFRLGHGSGTPMKIGAGFDIPDPYRKDRAAFERSLELIDAGVRGWSERINRLT